MSPLRETDGLVPWRAFESGDISPHSKASQPRTHSIGLQLFFIAKAFGYLFSAKAAAFSIEPRAILQDSWKPGQVQKPNRAFSACLMGNQIPGATSQDNSEIAPLGLNRYAFGGSSL